MEENVQLETGVKINLIIDHNKHTDAISAQNMLLKNKQASSQGVVCGMKESGNSLFHVFNERGDVLKEILFH